MEIVDPSELPNRSGVKQVYNKLVKNGFEVVRFTCAHGPILTPAGEDRGATGESIILAAKHSVDKRRCVFAWFDDAKGNKKLEWARVGASDDLFYYGYKRLGAAEAKKWIDA